jgi:SAM-dependent methyltransferase
MSAGGETLDTCPACGFHGNLAPDVRIGDYAVLVCPSCATGKTSPAPAPYALAAVNDATYALDAHVAERLARRDELAERSIPLLNWARAHAQVDSAVDIGSHLGFLLADFRQAGVSHLAGVELNADLRRWSSDHLGLTVVPRCRDLPPGGWDLVTMLDVLEHTVDPQELLGDASALVRGGGLILVQSPNRISEMARRSRERWSWWAMPDHLVHFTPEGIERLARRTELELVEIYTGDFVADYLMDVTPWLPRTVPLAIRRFSAGRRFYRRRQSGGGLIRALLRHPL